MLDHHLLGNERRCERGGWKVEAAVDLGVRRLGCLGCLGYPAV